MYNEKLNIIKTIYNKDGVMIKTQKNDIIKTGSNRYCVCKKGGGNYAVYF